MKWRNDHRSEMQFMQLCKEAWKKFGTSTGFEPMTSRYPYSDQALHKFSGQAVHKLRGQAVHN